MKRPILLLLLSGMLSGPGWAQITGKRISINPPANRPVWAQPDENSIISDLSRKAPVFLVQVEASKITRVPSPEPGFGVVHNTITLKITHVFAGRDSLVGTTFKGESIPEGLTFYGPSYRNLKLGEKAIYRKTC